MATADSSPDPVKVTVSPADVDKRLDAFLAEQFPLFSRVKLRRAINAGDVQVDGERTKAAYRLSAAQVISVVLPQPSSDAPKPEDIALDILYEDEHLAVVNKPPSMVVHPAKGHWSGTLTAALAFHFSQLSSVGGPTRPGIIHRLDRDTSGVIVVAKTDASHLNLAAQFENRTTEKEYTAIVMGAPDRDRDLIEHPIGVHPYQREKMAIRDHHSTSREAQTFYEVVERFRGLALLRVLPKTGRTHQIRVHLAHEGYPILCDRLYGGRERITRGEVRGQASDEMILLDRQALHARRLTIRHPASGELQTFEAPLPADMAMTLEALRRFRRVA